MILAVIPRFALTALPLLVVLQAAPSPVPESVDFNRDVRPILSENCYHCHGPDAANRKGKRRLDTFEGATAERNGTRAIMPGDSAASEVWHRIVSKEDDEVMPPRDSHLALTDAQKETLRRWIDGGAGYQPHWAFVPLPGEVSVPAPTGKNSDWPRTAIDRFVLARLELEKIPPSPEAPRERWLRRVTFDLTGLPPSQMELDAFLSDASSDAHARVVDRLLASQHFGERMAVPWLDLARYADSYGYQADPDTNAWPYRDWVVRALNANLPWNEFITWQIAGDLLPTATRDQRLATVFNRIHRKNNEGGSVPEEFRQEGVSDRVHTFGTAFLGLTLECARCHDHKYDPLSTRDYYALGAYFNSIDEFGLLQNGKLKFNTTSYPALQLSTPQQERELSARYAAVLRQEQLLREHSSEHESDFARWLAGPEAAMAAAASADMVGFYALEEEAGAELGNAVAAEKETPAARGAGNTFTAGRVGRALLCSGDDPIKLPGFGVRHAGDPLSFSFWLMPGELYPRAVVASNSEIADATYNACELILEDGRLRWSVIREYPGNCVSVQTVARLPVGAWTHVTVTYDGSMRAAGLRLYLDGSPAATAVVRDNLSRDYAVGRAIEFSARNRDSGLRGGKLDEIRVYTRALTPIEAAHVHDNRTLPALLAKPEWAEAETALLRDFYFSAVHPSARETASRLRAARTAWLEIVETVPEISVMAEMAQPRPTFVLARGAYDSPAEPVARETPAALPAPPADAPRDRLGLARWLTDPQHPLTARVIVNRLWQEFFGRGLVATPDNFGLQGQLPSHPELLDWLARDFIEHGWNFKRACREIVLSATYRQDSRVEPVLRERDPDNVLLARGPQRRLTAEMLRDTALRLGGLLQPQIGGPPVKPYQPEGSMWRALNRFLPDYERDTGAGLYRRSLYTFWRRTTTPPNMMALDATTREVCSVRRQATNTPLQPLVLLNDPQFVEAARALGQRMLHEGGDSPEARVAWAFREVAGRAPTPGEQARLIDLYQTQRSVFAKDISGAAKLLKVGEHPPAADLAPEELAAATTTAGALFNLDVNIVLR